MQAALEHTASSYQKNWCIPDLISFNKQESSEGIMDRNAGMKVTGITPYWINRFTAIQNDFDLRGLFLLTAPNMSGKSTLMRSILVAALLANCGLFVPCSTAQIPRYDNFFLRTSSHDVPSEGKSAFALEMQDMQIVLLDSTHQSLIMIDELGKSPGAIIAHLPLLLPLHSAQP
jgi:DNA mismatch repair ATPase MutS